MGTLISRMLRQSQGAGAIQQIGEELGLPEFTRNNNPQQQRPRGKWWQKQAEVAANEGFRSFTITRLKQNLISPDVEVDVFLIGRDEHGKWNVIREFQGRANADRQSAEDVAALMQEPQVKQLLEVADGLGLGAGGQIEKAIRHGVATQSAMQEALNQLAEFTNKYSRHLHAPPVLPEQ